MIQTGLEAKQHEVQRQQVAFSWLETGSVHMHDRRRTLHVQRGVGVCCIGVRRLRRIVAEGSA